jgi:hypothetical protein
MPDKIKADVSSRQKMQDSVRRALGPLATKDPMRLITQLKQKFEEKSAADRKPKRTFSGAGLQEFEIDSATGHEVWTTKVRKECEILESSAKYIGQIVQDCGSDPSRALDDIDVTLRNIIAEVSTTGSIVERLNTSISTLERSFKWLKDKIEKLSPDLSYTRNEELGQQMELLNINALGRLVGEKPKIASRLEQLSALLQALPDKIENFKEWSSEQNLDLSTVQFEKGDLERVINWIEEDSARFISLNWNEIEDRDLEYISDTITRMVTLLNSARKPPEDNDTKLQFDILVGSLQNIKDLCDSMPHKKDAEETSLQDLSETIEEILKKQTELEKSVSTLTRDMDSLRGGLPEAKKL